MRAVVGITARGVAAMLAILSALLLLGAAGASDTGSIGCGEAVAYALIGLLLMSVAVWIVEEVENENINRRN